MTARPGAGGPLRACGIVDQYGPWAVRLGSRDGRVLGYDAVQRKFAGAVTLTGYEVAEVYLVGPKGDGSSLRVVGF